MTMRASVVSTLVYGLVCGALFLPLAMVLGELLPGWMAWQLQILLYLAGFALLLWRASEARLLQVLMPLVFVACAAGIGMHGGGFVLLCLASLAWIRSGACFTRPIWRTLPAEMTVSVLSGLFLIFFEPHNGVTISLSVWIFFLIQSLYFVMVLKPEPAARPARDPFTLARLRAERILASRS